MTEDIDLKEFITKLIIWVVVVVLFGSLLTIILINKFGSKDIKINKKIDSQESIIILVVNSDDEDTKKIQKELKKNDLKYEIVYKDKERYYNEFLKKLSLTEEEVQLPAILYVEDGQTKSSLLKIEDTKMLKQYIKDLKEDKV